MKTIIKILRYGEWLWTNNPENDQVYVRDCLKIDPKHLKLRLRLLGLPAELERIITNLYFSRGPSHLNYK